LNHTVNLKNFSNKNIKPLSESFSGQSPDGEYLSFTNYYMEKNHKPFYPVSGECHYSRVHQSDWRDELMKMKQAGINTVSTYLFWNHHEEEEGSFCFEGRRDLRKFIEICASVGLYVIVRIGPFAHGEVRNGGLPDWLYGKPYEVRSLADGFLQCVTRLFAKYAEQMKGLYYKDGGPIIAAQIDNEYMHAGAPWEMTNGVSNEWVPAGTEQDAYMKKIKEIAVAAGIITPFYTATAWGGAYAPIDDMLPLWGGYPYRPWIFPNHKGPHPATEEYIYRDHHNNGIPATYNFEPRYQPEQVPYFCCEMGGGMMCSYLYRFQLPYESVDAMANIKLASGCNFLGYYMFKGGTNPLTLKGGFLNEGQVSKVSYDYQAAIGEFGQLRPSYHRLHRLHMLTESFAETLCKMKTVLPDGAEDIDPADLEQLRYSVRAAAFEKEGSGLFDGNQQQEKIVRGFLFLNNFQDHAVMKEKVKEAVCLSLDDQEICFDISLASGENAILPFNMDIDGILLKSATAQPLTVLKNQGQNIYVFFMPKGMKPVYEFAHKKVNAPDDRSSLFTMESLMGNTSILTLTQEDSMLVSKVTYRENEYLVLSEQTLLWEKDSVRIQSGTDSLKVVSYPDLAFLSEREESGFTQERDGIFEGCSFTGENADIKAADSLIMEQTGPTRYTIDFPKGFMDGKQEVLLRITYQGDIGHAFLGNRMISDQFNNNGAWEIGCKDIAKELEDEKLTICITPRKEGVVIEAETTMAGRFEKIESSVGVLEKAELVPVYEKVIRF